MSSQVRPARCYYTARASQLHGECFYNSLCDPFDETERRIREMSDHIEDVARLAAREIARGS